MFSFNSVLWNSILASQKLHYVIHFAQQHTPMCDKDIRIIKHYLKSLLYSENVLWKKKNTDNCFDVTMDKCDGEICEFVNTHFLSFLATAINKTDQ